VLFCALYFASSVFGQGWTQTGAPILGWSSVACSADGRTLVAAGWVSSPGYSVIYTSTNFGSTWSLADVQTSNPWAAVTSSADARRLAAATTTAGIYLSTNGGMNWTLSGAPSFGPNGAWSSLACSADGMRLSAAVFAWQFGGFIFSSTNAGATWTDSGLLNSFRSVIVSADGNRMVCGACYQTSHGTSEGVYLSTNAGGDWVLSSGSICAGCLASSADATKLFAATLGAFEVSTNSGEEWTATVLPIQSWISLAASADGAKVVAVSQSAPPYYDNNGSIFTTSDYGVTWVSNAAPPSAWQSVASSADGCRLFAAATGDGIYAFQTTPSPLLKIKQSGSSLLLSWIVPSMDFVLEESADLTNWFDVQAAPALNYTNLHYEVSLPAPISPRFYRLASQQ